MATKTDYYDRIISSLQSEITGLKNSLEILEKAVEDLQNVNASPDSPISIQQSEIEKAELLSQIAKVCNITINKRYSSLLSRFVDMDSFKNYCNHADSQYTNAKAFKIFEDSVENRFKLIEKRISKSFSLLTINRWKRDCDAKGSACSGLDTFLHTFTMNRYTRWLILFLLSFSVTMALLSAISENNHIRQENYNLYQTIELLKTSQK